MTCGFNVLSNIDAVHSPRLYEAWLEQDLQYIFNPGALGTQSDALVVGLRFNMTF